MVEEEEGRKKRMGGNYGMVWAGRVESRWTTDDGYEGCC